MTTLGIIGAGRIGSAIAKTAIAQGYDIVIANSRGPQTLADLIAELGPQATAATAAEAGAAGDVVVVTIPFKAIDAVPVEPLAGKIVIDTNNYYFERDGHIAALDDGETTVSGMLQAHLAESKVAKAFNHIFAGDIGTTGSPAGSPSRRALGTASDYPEAAAFVTTLHDQFGFDTVNVGPLSESWRIDRDRPAYGATLTRDEFVEAVARAQRTI